MKNNESYGMSFIDSSFNYDELSSISYQGDLQKIDDLSKNKTFQVSNTQLTNSSITAQLNALSSTWSTISGYGLTDAAAAVAQATNNVPFAEVTDLGGTQWFIDMVKAPEVWAKGYTGKDVTVAIVDTGVDINHSAFNGNIWTNSREIANNNIDDDGNGYIDDINGWDFVENDRTPQDPNSHGTHVAGIIDQIAPDAKLMAVRVANSTGFASLSNLARGVYYAANNGANVINLSMGGTFPMNTMLSAIRYAASKGCVVVMAAGNNGGATPIYPAAYASQYGLAVGAVTSTGAMASFSNKAGTTPLDYVVAPGVSIYSTLPGNRWGYKSGTSMATPIVSGVAALLFSSNRNLTPALVESLITGTAKQLGLTQPTSTIRTLSVNNSILNYPQTEEKYKSYIKFDHIQNNMISFSFDQLERFNRYSNSTSEIDILTGQLKNKLFH